MSTIPSDAIEPSQSLEPKGSGHDWLPSRGDRAAALNSGQWILLAVLAAFFLLFVGAYLMRMRHGDWLSLPEPALLWFNTLLLFASSVAFQVAAVRWPMRRQSALWWFHVAGALALLFIAGQLWVWRQIAASGYFVADNPATAFFFLLTALHGVHLLVGIGWWLSISYRVIAGQSELSMTRCVRYWHFLLLVWLMLLGLFVLT